MLLFLVKLLHEFIVQFTFLLHLLVHCMYIWKLYKLLENFTFL